MTHNVIRKLRGQAGETLAETLLALLLSALALAMLAGAITTTQNLLQTSENRLTKYYGNNNDLARRSDTGAGEGYSSGTLDLKLLREGVETALGGSGTSVKFYRNDAFAERPVVAYALSTPAPAPAPEP